MIVRPLLKQDLEHVLAQGKPAWLALTGCQLFLTGGTGFFGKWFLESIAYANDTLGCKIRATVLTRSSASFLENMPHLAYRKEFSWLDGDASTFKFPYGSFDYVLHLATFTSAYLEKIQPSEMLSQKLTATKHILDFARHSGARRILVTSSGAVYGQQPAELERICEGHATAPNPLLPGSAYGNGKRLVEQLCSVAEDLDCVIARCFSFLGPHLPLEARYAAGNFLRDAITGGPIKVLGDGTAIRSYLYPADLVPWLLHLLIRGERGQAYNVGSQHPVTTKDLALKIASSLSSPLDVHVKEQQQTLQCSRYVPDTTYSHESLGISECIDLDSAIHRTLHWLGAKVAS